MATSVDVNSIDDVYNIALGNTYTFYANILPTNTTNKALEWEEYGAALLIVKTNLDNTAVVRTYFSGNTYLKVSSKDGSGAYDIVKLNVIDVEYVNKLLSIENNNLTTYQEQLSSANNDLSNAQKEKVRVYTAAGWQYVTNESAVAAAQQVVDEWQKYVDDTNAQIKEYKDTLASVHY